ncbi:uncharacterized protein LOC135498373 [Lineus longissimus]|uniref:uncharacterized protein LOC135498373 n=1 Tax=Lineus longissimus TaxID=88925 RepID=UPI00315C53C8
MNEEKRLKEEKARKRMSDKKAETTNGNVPAQVVGKTKAKNVKKKANIERIAAVSQACVEGIKTATDDGKKKANSREVVGVAQVHFDNSLPQSGGNHTHRDKKRKEQDVEKKSKKSAEKKLVSTVTEDLQKSRKRALSQTIRREEEILTQNGIDDQAKDLQNKKKCATSLTKRLEEEMLTEYDGNDQEMISNSKGHPTTGGKRPRQEYVDLRTSMSDDAGDSDDSIIYELVPLDFEMETVESPKQMPVPSAYAVHPSSVLHLSPSAKTPTSRTPVQMTPKTSSYPIPSHVLSPMINTPPSCQSCLQKNHEITRLLEENRRLRTGRVERMTSPIHSRSEIENRYARPRPGYRTKEEAHQYQMVELVSGSGIYLYQDNIEPVRRRSYNAQNKTLSGEGLARGLMGEIFSREEIIYGSLSRTPKHHRLSTLDPRVIQAITSYCVVHGNTTAGRVRDAMTRKITSSRKKAKVVLE